MKRLLFLAIPIFFTVWSANAPATDLRLIALIGVWLTATLYAIPALSMPFTFLRKFPALLWVIWLIAMMGVITVWILRFQPAVGLPLSTTEQLWLVGCAITLILLPFAGYSPTEKVQIGWLAGPLMTLTTLVFMVIGVELAMRYVMVMSDNFQFSKMHSNWNRLYWNPINEMGYRDFEIPSSNDERINIIVMGDSLVTGYGVNYIENTFPHQLGGLLGDDYTVSIVAQPGWGVSSAFGALQDYPIMPDLLILSHYINDINEGTAGQQYGRSFPQIRVDPDEFTRWWTDRFYIANFLYYRVFLYTQHDAVRLYNSWVLGAYANDNVWRAYQQELQSVIDWSEANDIPLLVLVWGNLLNIDASHYMTEPVMTYFDERDIEVIAIGDYLRDMPVQRRVVNRYDAHPSIASHQIAADVLAQNILNE